MTPITRLERRAAGAVVGLSVAIFVGLLLVVPPFYQTFDEAKYLGIGYNFVTGNGPRTLFGDVFLPHSPTWPAIVVAPSIWFGGDPLSWGRAFNAIAGAGLLVLVAALGWQIRPAVGALAAAGYLAVPYLHDLARTARLDVPTAALMLGYVCVGTVAVRRGSVLWGLAAGAMLALAFLVKETTLVLAPVPFLYGILADRPWASVVRVGAVTMLVLVVATSWWFAIVADVTGRVYRLGAPAWTLVPLGLIAVLVGGAGLLAPRIAERADLPPRIPSGRARIIAWALAALWALALLILFGSNPDLRGFGLIEPRQWLRYLAIWLAPQIVVVVAVGIVGVLLAFLAWRRATVGRLGYALLAMIMLCSAPLILFAIALGEPPRNYLAQIGVLAGLSAAGWFGVAERIARRVADRRRQPDPTVAGLSPVWLVAGLAAVLIGASTLLAAHVARRPGSRTGEAQAAIVRDTTAWLQGNVAPGTPLRFGTVLGYEMSLELRGRHPMDQSLQTRLSPDISAKYGLALPGREDLADWVAVDVIPRRALEFYGHSASLLSRQLGDGETQYFVYVDSVDGGTAALPPALANADGVTRVASFRHVAAEGTPAETAIESHIYRIDGRPVAFPEVVHFTPAALDQLLGFLEADAGAASTVARTLLDEITITGDPSAAQQLRERLTVLAGR